MKKLFAVLFALIIAVLLFFSIKKYGIPADYGVDIIKNKVNQYENNRIIEKVYESPHVTKSGNYFEFNDHINISIIPCSMNEPVSQYKTKTYLFPI